MKNKFEADLVGSGKYANDLPENVAGHGKTTLRRESMAPKIVVCPPVEEMSEPAPAPRGSRILKVLSKRLSRRSMTDADSVASSSSSESMADENGRNEEHSSSSLSDSSSDGSERHRRNRSTVSLRRVFKHLNLTSRSQSSSPVERQRQPKKQAQPKRILRPPVTYTYVCGLSGLPTQRVPRHLVTGVSAGLNR